MSKPTTIATALCAQDLPPPSQDDGVPEWVHLLPVGRGAVATGDQRGPYHVTNAHQIVAASMMAERLPIDENHATDLAAPSGMPAPARGWIVEMQARTDGIWGRVEWTAAGRELVASRAYRAISPVIIHDKAKRIVSIPRASLVNRPNLRGLTALNQETDDMFQANIAGLLGLNADAAEAEITAAIAALQGAQDETAALQAQIDEIGTVLGVETGGDVLAAATAAAAQEGDDTTIAALQAELTQVATELATIRDANRRGAAVAFVDQAIRDRRVGVSPQRERFISLHMKDPEGTEELIKGFPTLDRSLATIEPPAPKDGKIALNAEQSRTATLLGVDPEAYAKTLAAERSQENAA